VTFPTTMGLELTYIKGRHNSCSDLVARVAYLCRQLKSIQRHCYHAYNDFGALEFNTLPSTNITDLLTAYTVVTRVAKRHGFTSHMEKILGGGCHVSINLSLFCRTKNINQKKLIWTMCDELEHKPYLGWVFNEAEDDVSCFDKFCFRPNGTVRTKKGCPLHIEPLNRSTYGRPILKKSPGAKDLRCEFRIFEMPTNKRELEQIIKFVWAFLEYCTHLLDRSPDECHFPPRAYIYLKNHGKDGLKVFEDFLFYKLGLNPQRYRGFVQRNYWKRMYYKRTCAYTTL